MEKDRDGEDALLLGNALDRSAPMFCQVRQVEKLLLIAFVFQYAISWAIIKIDKILELTTQL